MNVLRCNDANYATRLEKVMGASSLFDSRIENQTRKIIEEVRKGGDAALSRLAKRFDRVDLQPHQFAVTRAELVSAAVKADEALREAIEAAHRNIEAFSRRSLRRDWSLRNAQGGRVGEKYDPFGRVGLYIPGGTAPLVSSALMTVTLARVAGCRDILVTTPCGPDGQVNPALLHALGRAGATQVLKLGGAQAIAAMAFGTATIAPVQKIFGPGNAYVVTAKRLLFGRVAIDLLPGPSEVLVLGDESSNPTFVAADLLAQAEHGSGHERVWLVTPSMELIEAVREAIKHQLPNLSRSALVRKALRKNGWLIQVPSLEEGIELANRIAPEHCEIMTRHPSRVAARIVTAGGLFLGPWTPTVLGDYMAGPSHTLPTGGAGASFAGLTVDQFQRRTSVVRYERSALKKSLAAVAKLAELEGLDAHGRSASLRLDRHAAHQKVGC